MTNLSRTVLRSALAGLMLYSFAACASATNESPTATPSASQAAKAETLRLWVARTRGAHSVTGYIEPSGTGNSIRYQLAIAGDPDYININVRLTGDLVAQSGWPLRGERSHTGYLDTPDFADAVTGLFNRPNCCLLHVYLKDGDPLTARFTRSPTPD